MDSNNIQNIKTQDIKIQSQFTNLHIIHNIHPKLQEIKKMVEKLKNTHYVQNFHNTQTQKLQNKKIRIRESEQKSIKSNTRYNYRSVNTIIQQQPIEKYNKQKINLSHNLLTVKQRHKRPLTLDIQKSNTQPSMFKQIDQINSSINESRTPKNHFMLRKKKKIMPIRQKTEIFQNQYVNNLKNLQYLYDSLASILIDIKKIKDLLFQKIKKYIELIRQPKFLFIAEFISTIDSKYIKQLVLSRVFQYFSIIILIIQLITNNKKDNQGHITNFIGHSTSNLIFLSKLYMIKNKRNNWNSSNYQSSISQFLKQSFNQTFNNTDDILLKIQLNNQIMNILANKLSHKLFIYSKFRDFTKTIEPDTQLIQQSLHFMFQYLAFFIHQNHLTGIFPSVDIPLPPFINQYPQKSQKAYTIIIQPYGVLMFLKKQTLRIRLNAGLFLQKISHYSNIIFWTSLMPNQIDKMLNYLNYNNLVQRILYRYHANIDNQKPIKNLFNIGRQLSRVLILDVNSDYFMPTPKNGLQISWMGAKNDSKLLPVQKILNDIQMKKLSIPQGIQIFGEQLKRYLKKQTTRYNTEI